MNKSLQSPPLEGSPLGSPRTVAATSRSVREMFAAVAPRYDFLNHFLSAGLDLSWRRAAAKAVREPLARLDSVALDICCGTGDLAFALRRVSAGKIFAADFCQPMLEQAKAKSRNTSRPVSLMSADALSLPVRNGSVDVITSAFGFRNLASYELGLREIHRALKPGGVLAILEFSHVRWPLFGPLFRLYFAHVLPRVGTWVSGIRGPYQYLHNSASRFPDQETLAETMRRSGFVKVRYLNFMGGVAALHFAEKGEAEGPAGQEEIAI
ncbi:MAG TPA: ubiquinone/menaquinone biosynthesis methyltransferase [Terriglobia bacterium]|nr:ubiquinone/menaquinone biosynthesis methyltransferase [Terriglobia bacterium]